MNSAFQQLSDELKPREQLRDHVKATDMKPEALLAILLKTGTADCHVLETARRLLDAFGSTGELVKSDWRTLQERIRIYNEAHPKRKIKGVGEVKMLELAAAFELVRRGLEEAERHDIRTTVVKTPDIAARIFRAALLPGEEKESVFVLPLDAKLHPLCTEPVRVTHGSSDHAPFYIREIFRDAMRWGAGAIIVAHNHPSGDPTPSAEDLDLTRQMVAAGRIVEIAVQDHLVLGRHRVVSLHATHPDCFL